MRTERLPAHCFDLAGGCRISLQAAVALEAFCIDYGRTRSPGFLLDGRLVAAGVGTQGIVGWQSNKSEFAGTIGLAEPINEFSAALTGLYPSLTSHRTGLVGGLVGVFRITPNLSLRMDLEIVAVALEGEFLLYSRGSDVATLMLGAAFRF